MSSGTRPGRILNTYIPKAHGKKKMQALSRRRSADFLHKLFERNMGGLETGKKD